MSEFVGSLEQADMKLLQADMNLSDWLIRPTALNRLSLDIVANRALGLAYAGGNPDMQRTIISTLLSKPYVGRLEPRSREMLQQAEKTESGKWPSDDRGDRSRFWIPFRSSLKLKKEIGENAFPYWLHLSDPLIDEGKPREGALGERFHAQVVEERFAAAVNIIAALSEGKRYDKRLQVDFINIPKTKTEKPMTNMLLMLLFNQWMILDMTKYVALVKAILDYKVTEREKQQECAKKKELDITTKRRSSPSLFSVYF